MTPARFRWGLLLILVGTLILLQKTDTIGSDVWLDLLYYVPYLLIAIGIEKLFTRSKFEIISYATSVLLVAGAAYVAASSDPAEPDSDFFRTEVIEEPFDSAITGVDAQLTLAGGGLTIRDATDELVYAKFQQWTPKPKYTLTKEGGRAIVEFVSRSGQLLWGMVDVGEDADAEGNDDWYLMFSRDVPLRLTCDADRSDLHLNLSTTQLEALNLKADDADIYIKLGDLTPAVQVDVRGLDSKLRLRIPRDAGLRVIGVGDDEYLQQVGLSRDNGAFISDGYDTLRNKIDVNLDDRFRSLSIDYY
jgi:hypothetical protein